MSSEKHTPQLALPWTSTANSWQFTTIYDVNDVPVCRFDLEDWGVDEDNQDALEARQAAVVSAVVRAVNSHAEMLEALKSAEEWLSGWASAEPYLSVVRAAIAKAEGRTALSSAQAPKETE